MVRATQILVLLMFVTIAIALPFALGTCGSSGGTFCGMSGHADSPTDCTPHTDMHFSLLTQFRRCVPEKAMLLGVLLSGILALLITLMQHNKEGSESATTTNVSYTAHTAPNAGMKPFDSLLLAFARGITNARRNVHVFFT